MNSPVVCSSFQSAFSLCLRFSTASTSSGGAAWSCPREGAASPRREEHVGSIHVLSSSYNSQNEIINTCTSTLWRNEQGFTALYDPSSSLLTCMSTSMCPWARPCSSPVSCCHTLSHMPLPGVWTNRTRLGSYSYPRGRRRPNTACMNPDASLQPCERTDI